MKIFIITNILFIIMCINFVLYTYFSNKTYPINTKYPIIFRNNFKNSLYSHKMNIKVEEYHKNNISHIIVKNLNDVILLVLEPNMAFINMDIKRKLKGCLGPEDTRLLNNKNLIYIFYCDDYLHSNTNSQSNGNKLGCTVYMKQIYPDIKKSLPLVIDNMNIIEKNWSPFFKDDELYIIYSFYPYMIVYLVNTKDGNLTLISKTSTNIFKNIRGGTNGIPYKNNTILTLCHIQKSNKDYYHMFLLFDNQYPFTIRKYSNLFKFFKNKIEFATHIEEHNNNIYISYGISDKYSVTVQTNIQQIDNILI